ncbi:MULTISPECIES: lipoprotein LpqH [unclassified Mycobacteroides]|uniref:lipoprotein LpqH n=1 Tax=unclassified Mycobacteroides TaxID=2618759 RepID=UPI0013968AEE|nr:MULTISPECIES: lipoprotein LpqH [unclassified Mycobacteroides]
MAATANNAPRAQVGLPPNALMGSGGSAKITLGGQVSSLTGPVECRFRGGSSSNFAIEVGGGGGGHIGSYLNKPLAPQVEYVNIRNVDGLTLLAKGDGSNGNVTVTKKQGGYVLAGSGTALRDSGMEYDFEFTVDVTCPEGWDRSR